MFKKTVVKKEVTPPPTIVEPEPQPEPLVPFNPDEEEDLLEVFRNNPVPRQEIKRQHNNVSQHWADILDRDEPLSSMKLDALRDQLAEWRENHSEDKIIIFSQFVRGLDLVEKLCDEQGWKVTRYQGEMTLEQRETSLRTFEDDDEVMIMLTSLKCGGVGLNLTGISLLCKY
jgi:SNF2 family DNA or RNA helicase